ncbi:MAG TPA: tetratricopeptide repeat protein [Myxococcales bacterium]|nr:tetratricopeptide repeat protein [Myxococcales bacterium]
MPRPGAALAAALLALTVGGCAHGPAAPERSPKEEAHALLQANQPERATALLSRLHAQDPDDLDVARWLVEAHVKAGTADQLLPELLAAWPAHEEVRHYMLGLLAFGRSAGEAPRAVTELQQAAAAAPGRAELHYRLGLVLLETEAYPPAAAELRKVRELQPDHRPVLLPLCQALARTGDRAGAVEALRLLVKAGPTPAEVKTARALMTEISDPFAGIPKAAQGKLDEGMKWLHEYDAPQPAIVAFEEVLRDFPDLAPVHALLGLAYQRLDDGGRAMESFKRAVELQPGVGRNFFYLGEVYRAHQRPDAAQEQYARALALDPLLDDAYLRLGDLALERKDLAAARDAYAALASLQPDSTSARGKLAAALQLNGELAAADRELRAALHLDPESVELQLRLGLLHAERSLRATRDDERRQAAQEAERWLRKVLDAQPENAVASRTLETLKAKE